MFFEGVEEDGWWTGNGGKAGGAEILGQILKLSQMEAVDLVLHSPSQGDRSPRALLAFKLAGKGAVSERDTNVSPETKSHRGQAKGTPTGQNGFEGI